MQEITQVEKKIRVHVSASLTFLKLGSQTDTLGNHTVNKHIQD